MAWEGSTRKESLPPNWQKLRAERFKIDGFRCTQRDVYGERCEEPAQECDHHGDRLDHRIQNLRSLCSWHHQKKSSRQGAQARYAKKRAFENKFRRTETHPAFLG